MVVFEQITIFNFQPNECFLPQLQDDHENHRQKPMKDRYSDQLSSAIPSRLRQCPNHPHHPVYGTPYHYGGREWLCVECGLEWEVVKEEVRYYLLDEEGGRKHVKTIPLNAFAEAQH